nr:uncharacterized protein LOC126529474 [Dermacentor andersoni]
MELLGGSGECTVVLDHFTDNKWLTDVLYATTSRSVINFTAIDFDNGTHSVPASPLYRLIYTDYTTCFLVMGRQSSRQECFLWSKAEPSTLHRKMPTACDFTYQSKCRGKKEDASTNDCRNTGK